MLLLGPDFREDVAHFVGEDVHQLVEKRILETKRAAVAHRPAQDATQDVMAVVVAGLDAVGNGKAEGADMVGDDAEGDVQGDLLSRGGNVRAVAGDFLGQIGGLAHLQGCGGGIHLNNFARAFAGGFERFAGSRTGGGVAGKGAAVGFAAQFFEGVENRAENVGLVIGDFGVGKIGEAFGALDDAGHPFKAHAGVHVLGRERHELAVRVGVELDEHQVPDFNALRAALVHQLASGIARRGQIHMQFRARTARPSLAHHPKIVFFAAVNDMDVRVQPHGLKFLGPVVIGFQIKFAGFLECFAGIIDGGIQPFRREFPDLDDQFPRPVNGLLFEIIAKGPVPKHFKESVVVGIQPHIVQVVVLAAGADTLLGVGGATRGVRAAGLAQENGHKLVHPRVGEQQIGRIRQQAGRRHNGVILGLEKVEEILPDLTARTNCWTAHKYEHDSITEPPAQGEQTFWGILVSLGGDENSGHPKPGHLHQHQPPVFADGHQHAEPARRATDSGAIA